MIYTAKVLISVQNMTNKLNKISLQNKELKMKKTNKVILTVLVASLVLNASAEAEIMKSVGKYTPYIPFGLEVEDVAKSAVTYGVETASMPVAVYGASTLGVTASTGTAISSLSGAAAVSATSASIGTAIAGGAVTVGGVVIAPVVMGGVVITVVAAGVAYGINSLLFDDE